MKTFFKVSIILMMAIVLAAGTALAAPVRLDSITVADSNNNSPSRVAVDAQGNLYVSVPASNAVRKYSATGQPLGAFSVSRPAGLAVDVSGNIYVCSVNFRSEDNKNSVLVFNADLVNTGTLGAGEGEFAKPIDVAIDGNGRIYVVDAGNHKIKVFDAAGNFAFGAFGNAAGSLNKPTGIAINDAAGELYVTDRPAYTDTNGTTIGARIQVFDKNGAFKRSFGQFGTGVGQIQSPQGIAVDGAGTLYAADSGQNVVHVMNPADGSAVGAGGLYDPTKPGYNPSGVATTKNGLLYIVYQRGETPAGRIDKYGLDGFVTMAVDPSSLTFLGTQFSGNPAPQTLVITNTGGGTLNWSATADQAWIKLGKMDPVAPASAAGLAVGADIASLGVGTYTGKVTIDSGFGQKAVIGVTLNIVPAPVLNISNGWLSFAAKRGKSPAAQAITISIDNASSQQWSVQSDAAWLTMTPSSGAAATATIAVDSANLAIGSYTGLLTVSAPGVIGDGGKITVNLNVAPESRIQVSTNRADASFTITGPANFTGTGMDWSADAAPAGDYTVTFDGIAGYKRPFSQTRKLEATGSVSFTGNYASFADLAAKKNIVAAKGPNAANDAQIKVFKNNGSQADFDLLALTTKSGASVAVGDVDGDGAADLIVGAGAGQNNPATVRVFRTADKSMIAEITPFGTLNGAGVAAGDIDGDGNAEVLVADNLGRIDICRYANGKLASTGIRIAGMDAAVADTANDGKPEVVTVSKNGMMVWNVDIAAGAATRLLNRVNLPATSVAAGDFDGDGTEEILISGIMTDAGRVAVQVVEAFGSREKPIVMNRASAHVAAADLDGDGIAEAIVGTPDASTTGVTANDAKRPTVHVYGADGVRKFAFRAFSDEAQHGVNVAVGDLGL